MFTDTACDVTRLNPWEMKVVMQFLEGLASRAELIYYLQTDSGNIPVVECLLKIAG